MCSDPRQRLVVATPAQCVDMVRCAPALLVLSNAACRGAAVARAPWRPCVTCAAPLSAQPHWQGLCKKLVAWTLEEVKRAATPMPFKTRTATSWQAVWASEFGSWRLLTPPSQRPSTHPWHTEKLQSPPMALEGGEWAIGQVSDRSAVPQECVRAPLTVRDSPLQPDCVAGCGAD